jgi:uncharacterized protein YlxW (UPF0749 family)
MPEMPRTPENLPDPDGETPAGRDALFAALRSKPSRAQALVGLLLFVVGFGAATQVRSNEQDDQFAGLRQDDLVSAFDGLAASTERAENEIDRLTQTKEELQNSTTSRRAALEAARQQEAVLDILAGAVPTVGPGIRITITDEAGAVSDAVVLDLVQELRAIGAEAIEVNDRIRLIAQSSIEQGDAGITIDGELVEAPYVIDVIGEPETLEGSLDFPGGPVERVEKVSGTLVAEPLDEVQIESVVDVERPDFADPVDNQ